MPFELKKIKYGWKVVDDKGREYSRRPLTKKRATAQLRALYSAYERGEFKEVKGGYVVKHEGTDHTLLYGEGFFSDVYDKVKRNVRKVYNFVKNIPPIRKDYPPNVRTLLSQYGEGLIVGMYVRREPIKSFINTALQYITDGKWDKAKKDANYDNMFHLSLVADVKVGTEVKAVLIEKNEVINMTTSFSSNPDISIFRLATPNPMRLIELMDRTKERMGERFFLYDAFENNCQNFVLNLVESAGVMTPEARAFIYQPVDVLLKSLPSYTPFVARAVTDLGALANRIFYGEGACCDECALGKACKSSRGGARITIGGRSLISIPYFGVDEGSIHQIKPIVGRGKTHRQKVFDRYGWDDDKSPSLKELSEVSKVPIGILQQVYNRGVGAYKTQPKSVRLKGSFVKNVDAPMSAKLSKEQWGMARVYSFLDGNPKHDNDLRANRGGAFQTTPEEQKALLESEGFTKAPEENTSGKDLVKRDWETEKQFETRKLKTDIQKRRLDTAGITPAQRQKAISEANIKRLEADIKAIEDMFKVQKAYAEDPQTIAKLAEIEDKKKKNAFTQKLNEEIRGLYAKAKELGSKDPKVSALIEVNEAILRLFGASPADDEAREARREEIIQKWMERKRMGEEYQSRLGSQLLDMKQRLKDMKEGARKYDLAQKGGGMDTESVMSEEEDLSTMAGGSITSQLKLLKIPKATYLKSIRTAGKAKGYDEKKIMLSDDNDHKIMVVDDEGKKHYAGRVGYGDFHIWTQLEKKKDVPSGFANEKQKGYLARATKIKGDWKKDKYSPNSLAIALLW